MAVLHSVLISGSCLRSTAARVFCPDFFVQVLYLTSLMCAYVSVDVNKYHVLTRKLPARWKYITRIPYKSTRFILMYICVMILEELEGFHMCVYKVDTHGVIAHGHYTDPKF